MKQQLLQSFRLKSFKAIQDSILHGKRFSANGALIILLTALKLFEDLPIHWLVTFAVHQFFVEFTAERPKQFPSPSAEFI